MKHLLNLLICLLIAGSVAADTLPYFDSIDALWEEQYPPHENQYVERVDTTWVEHDCGCDACCYWIKKKNHLGIAHRAIDTTWAEYETLKLTKKQHKFFMDWLDKWTNPKRDTLLTIGRPGIIWDEDTLIFDTSKTAGSLNPHIIGVQDWKTLVDSIVDHAVERWLNTVIVP